MIPGRRFFNVDFSRRYEVENYLYLFLLGFLFFPQNGIAEAYSKDKKTEYEGALSKGDCSEPSQRWKVIKHFNKNFETVERPTVSKDGKWPIDFSELD